jgi:protocatechuate 3,4-dioxygenase beta subunit
VVFTHGYVLRVENYRVEGDQARLALPTGGAVWFPLAKIARVVAHEVDLTPEERLLPAMDLALGDPDTEPAGAHRTSGRGTSNGEEVDPAELDPAHSISGRVLDEAGEPVAGIELSARPVRLFRPTSGGGNQQQQAQARSDQDGSYRFEQLVLGEYGVSSFATDRYTSGRTVVRTGTDFANLVLNEKRQLSIYGTVTDTQEAPLAKVRVTPAYRPSAATDTDQKGRYRVEIPVAAQGRAYTLRFELEDYRERTLTIADNQVLGRSRVRLDARLELLESLVVVGGRVSTQEGAPLPGETVYLRGKQHYQAVTNEAGEFSIPEVESQTTYRLSIRPRGPYRDHSERVEVSAEGLEVSVVLDSEPLEYGSLSGRMIDLSGKPLPHFSLWLRSSNGSAQQPLLVTSDASGLFTVPAVPLGRLSFTSVSNPRLTVSGPDLSSETTENVELILDWGSYAIQGRVLDGYGNPVAAPRVILQWSHRQNGLQSLSVRRSSADANGFFLFTRVGPGRHSVTVAAPGFEPVRLEAESPGNLVVQLRGPDEEGDLQGK